MNRAIIYCLLPFLFIQMSCKKEATKPSFTYIDLSGFEDGIHHWNLYSKVRSDKRLDSTDIQGIADNLLAYQNEDGGWPKNIDWLSTIDPDSVVNELSEKYRQSTFDNRNIFPQIEYLANVYLQKPGEKYRIGAEKGFQYILDTEYSKGGWRGWDADVITFNDNVMTGIMDLLLDVKQHKAAYYWLSPGMRAKLMKAYERGLEVILKCQVEIQGTKSAWCQQHDFDTHEPVKGRDYEHPSVTARESSDIILFLMRIQDPDSAIVQAVESAVKWLESSRIMGYRYGNFPIPERPYHESTIDFDREFVPDSTARPVWARYYDLKEGKPFLSLRDGKIVYSLEEISFDRRVGYEWYGFWPEEVLSKYHEWIKGKIQ
jgi:PelA/Pel-15E family pectate lyase